MMIYGPRRERWRAYCMERGALLYQLGFQTGPNNRPMEKWGYTAHIYWPHDPRDPLYYITKPLVCRWTTGATIQEAVDKALAGIDEYDGKPSRIWYPTPDLLMAMDKLEGAIGSLVDVIREQS